MDIFPQAAANYLEAILADVLAAPDFLLTHQQDITEVLMQHQLLADGTRRYAIAIPSQQLAKACQPLVAANIVDAVLLLTDSPWSLLLINSVRTQSKLVFYQARLADMNALLVSKIVGAYRRAYAVATEPAKFSSPVCYASQFSEPAIGVLIDNLALVADVDELKQCGYSLDTRHYFKLMTEN